MENLEICRWFDGYIKSQWGLKSLNELLSDSEKLKIFFDCERGAHLNLFSNSDYAGIFKQITDFLSDSDHFTHIKENILKQHPLTSEFFVSWIESKPATEEGILSIYAMWERVSARENLTRFYCALSDFICLAVERAYQIYINELEWEAESKAY